MPEGTVVEPVGSTADDPPCSDSDLVTDPARLRQRAVFLRELAQARALLARPTPTQRRSIGAGEWARQSVRERSGWFTAGRHSS